jgi:hypothetical protein
MVSASPARERDIASPASSTTNRMKPPASNKVLALSWRSRPGWLKRNLAPASTTQAEAHTSMA